MAEEARFIKTLPDFRRAWQKCRFAAPRLFGRRYTALPVPLGLQLEPTNHCNLRCICCSRQTMRRELGFMDMGLFRKIVDEAAMLKVCRVFLYLHGEPLLHPQIGEMLRQLKARGLAVTLTTNGMLLDKPMIDTLLRVGLDNGDHLLVSILGHSREVHETIMGGVDHGRVVDNLRQLLAARRARRLNGPVIETVMYSMAENAHEKRDFERHWQPLVDHVRDVGMASNSFAGGTGSGRLQRVERKNCPNLWERLTVFWNGDVPLCCADVDGSCLFGNLGETTIAAAWNHGRYREIQQLHAQAEHGRIPLCSGCDL